VAEINFITYKTAPNREITSLSIGFIFVFLCILVTQRTFMKSVLFFLPLLLLFACKTLTLATELNDRETYQLYQQAIGNDTLYTIRYNPDSTYALCILNDKSDLVSEPISFFIVNVASREKVLISLNEYHKAAWIDSRNVSLVSYSGIANHSRELNKKPVGGFMEYIFNVTSGDIKSYKPQPEK
jgi:hypothetical protein